MSEPTVKELLNIYSKTTLTMQELNENLPKIEQFLLESEQLHTLESTLKKQMKKTEKLTKTLEKALEQQGIYKNKIEQLEEEVQALREKVEQQERENSRSIHIGNNRKCPYCGSDLEIQRGMSGEILRCVNFPNCNYVETIEQTEIDDNYWNMLANIGK